MLRRAKTGGHTLYMLFWREPPKVFRSADLMDERPVTKRPKWIRLFDHDGNLGRVLLCQPAILLPCKSSEGPSVSFLLFSASFFVSSPSSHAAPSFPSCSSFESITLVNKWRWRREMQSEKKENDTRTLCRLFSSIIRLAFAFKRFKAKTWISFFFLSFFLPPE